MSYDAAAAGNWSARSNHDLYLYVRREDTSGNAERFSWALYVRRNSGSVSYVLDAQAWSVNVAGYGYSGSHNLDLRSTAMLLIAAGTTGYVAHDANGYLNIGFSAAMGPAPTFGSASCSGGMSADRIARVPYQPPVATITSTTLSVANMNIALPGDNGGAAVIDFYMEMATDSAFTTVVQSRTGTDAAQTFTGLNPATQYYFRYRARNSVGSSDFSPTATPLTQAGPPSAPLNPAVTGINPIGATLGWDPPATTNGAAVTGYRITRALDAAFSAGATQFTQGNVLSRTFTDLLPSTTYYFKVAAINSVGPGPDTAAVSATTVSGVSYSNGTVWQAAGIFVSDGTNWIPGEIQVSDGTNWIAAV